MRKFTLNKVPSVESAEVQTPLPEVTDLPVTIEPIEGDSEVTEYSEGCDELCNTVTALESLLVSVESSLNRGGLTASELHFANMHLNYLSASIGLNKVTVSSESGITRLAQTQITVESIGNIVKQAVVAIVEFMKRMYNAMLNAFEKFKEWLSNKGPDLAAKVEKMPEEKYVYRNHMNDNQFYFNGKRSSDILGDLIKSIDVVTNIDLSYVAEIKKFSTYLAERQFKDSMESYESRLRDIAMAAYRSLDNSFKFNKNTNLSTTVVSGYKLAGAIYAPEASNASSIILDASDNPFPTSDYVTLKDLGINVQRARELQPHVVQLSTFIETWKSVTRNAISDLERMNNDFQGVDLQVQHLIREALRLSAKISKIHMTSTKSVMDCLNMVYRAC